MPGFLTVEVPTVDVTGSDLKSSLIFTKSELLSSVLNGVNSSLNVVSKQYK